MFVVNKAGQIGAVAFGWTFTYSYQRAGMAQVFPSPLIYFTLFYFFHLLRLSLRLTVPL